MIKHTEHETNTVELNDYLQKLKRQKAREEYRNYKLGFERGRNYQHKAETKDRFWIAVGIATTAFVAGVWMATLLTNGTWSWN